MAIWITSAAHGPAIVSREPGADRLGLATATLAPTDLRGSFVPGEGKASELVGDWPRFRGAGFDNIANAGPALAEKWSNTGPQKLWQVDLGEGYAGAAIHKGRVYLLDYDAKTRADALRCLSLDDGREIWTRAYPVDVKRNHGMSRTVPAVTDRFVVTLGPKCHVLCADAVSGQYLWGLDLPAQFHTRIPPWYAGQCPLIDGDRAILAPGADALMIAVNCADGKIIWKTPNPSDWQMTHSSIMPMTFAGKPMYVYCASGGVVGVSADDGAILWQSSAWKVNMATVPSPVPLEDGKIFLSGGYGAGSMLLQLTESAGQISSKIIYRLDPETFGSEQQTPIYHGRFIYGVIPGGQLVCLDPADGKVKWTSGSTRFGIGPYLLAGENLFLLNDTGVLSIVRATPKEFALLSKSTVLEKAHESWAPMALAAGRIILRDLRRLACFNLTGGAS